MSLNNLIQVCLNSQDLISHDRKQALNDLASSINDLKFKNSFVDLICVCTHNSRRSQLAEWWIRQACGYYDISEIYAYSGGTEATSFNYRMVEALNSFGISFETIENEDNPKYLHSSDEQLYFSKTYDDQFNPQTAFMAIMVCDHADENCPVVIGAAKRFSLPYIDPKEADNTANEGEVYQEKVLEIGREMLYLTKSIKNLISSN